jgi:hypothetical protein
MPSSCLNYWLQGTDNYEFGVVLNGNIRIKFHQNPTCSSRTDRQREDTISPICVDFLHTVRWKITKSVYWWWCSQSFTSALIFQYVNCNLISGNYYAWKGLNWLSIHFPFIKLTNRFNFISVPLFHLWYISSHISYKATVLFALQTQDCVAMLWSALLFRILRVQLWVIA